MKGIRLNRLIFVFLIGFALTSLVACTSEDVSEIESQQVFDKESEANTRNNQWSNRSHGGN